jgi:predicted nucleotidyltransferase component of viral defense system
MFDINRHRFLLGGILHDIFSSTLLAPLLGFKGGTALMFFYGLPRFSVDLDFNLLKTDKEEFVFASLHPILQKYGAIHDEAIKRYGSVLVLDYEKGGRKLKVEVSNRVWDNHYEAKDFYGTTIQTMTAPDMFSHKLCALLDRSQMTNRDIFDCWFFMNRRTALNPQIIRERMKLSIPDYLERCIESVKRVPENHLLDGMGDLMDEKLKDFTRTKLKGETLNLMQFYHDYPLVE